MGFFKTTGPCTQAGWNEVRRSQRCLPPQTIVDTGPVMADAKL
jgi:hypothetical protein